MSTQPTHSRRWSSGAYGTRNLPIPDCPTHFEQLIFRLGLEKRPDLWQFNSRVHDFAVRNRNTRYVPESLLRELGLESEDAA